MAHALLTLDNTIKVLGPVGGLGGVAAWLTYRLKTREVGDAHDQFVVTSAQALTETALAMLEPVRAALAEAEKKVGELQAQMRTLEAATARSEAEKSAIQAQLDEVQRQLAATRAERDRLAEELARRAAANGVLTQGPETA